ncbi:MAG TPA: methyltransferase domain-containing protein [Paracoccaceae bacterium]|nr:methyltransferase domain-containing protein [Paracoccaceae bacterium]
MTTPPNLFDRDMLSRRRARARAIGGADFLHREVAAQISERLEEVNKSFTDAAIIGPQPAIWAQELALDPDLPALYHVPDDEVLPVKPSAHDLILHGLALHWANDPVGQLVQARRALRPDGLFIGALFGGQTLQELRIAFAEAETQVEGGLSPRVAPMGEIRDLGALLQRAGFAMPVADSSKLSVTYQSPLHLMRDLRAMGETNVLTSRRKSPLRRETLQKACQIYAENFGLPDGRVRATFEVIFLTGWAPAESQPKPLRPGSAAARLADALGTTEVAAGEATPRRK